MYTHMYLTCVQNQPHTYIHLYLAASLVCKIIHMYTHMYLTCVQNYTHVHTHVPHLCAKPASYIHTLIPCCLTCVQNQPHTYMYIHLYLAVLLACKTIHMYIHTHVYTHTCIYTHMYIPSPPQLLRLKCPALPASHLMGSCT